MTGRATGDAIDQRPISTNSKTPISAMVAALTAFESCEVWGESILE
jgi:hypothetical protein